jgi:hypothetical protein
MMRVHLVFFSFVLLQQIYIPFVPIVVSLVEDQIVFGNES